MTAASPLRLSLPHYDLAGLRFGSDDGIPCLCLHGWLDNANSFAPLAEALPEFQWVALDFLGHGHSDWIAPGQRYHLLDHIPAIAEALDALGWRQCHLLGHSMGGCLVPALSASLPGRFLSFTSLEALGPLAEPAASLPERLEKAQRDRQRAHAPPRVYDSVDSATAQRLKATRMAPASARLIVERNLRAVDGGYCWRYDPRLRDASPAYLSESQCHALLQALSIPTLGLLGDRGYILKRENYHARSTLIPHYREHILPGDHHVHMDTPEQLAPLIDAFVRQHSSAS